LWIGFTDIYPLDKLSYYSKVKQLALRVVLLNNVNLLLYRLNGPNTGIDWTLEGRRTIPLLPRLKARSAFTTLANSLSLTTAIANEKKPDRCNTNRQSGNSTGLLNDNCNNGLFKLYYLS